MCMNVPMFTSHETKICFIPSPCRKLDVMASLAPRQKKTDVGSAMGTASPARSSRETSITPEEWVSLTGTVLGKFDWGQSLPARVRVSRRLRAL